VKEKRNGGQYKSVREMTREDLFGERGERKEEGYLRSLKRTSQEDPDENGLTLTIIVLRSIPDSSSGYTMVGG
jgi:hypothetical protein